MTGPVTQSPPLVDLVTGDARPVVGVEGWHRTFEDPVGARLWHAGVWLIVLSTPFVGAGLLALTNSQFTATGRQLVWAPWIVFPYLALIAGITASVMCLARLERDRVNVVVSAASAVGALSVVAVVAVVAVAAGLTSGLSGSGSWAWLVAVAVGYGVAAGLVLARLIAHYGRRESGEQRTGAALALVFAVVPVGLTFLVLWGPNIWPDPAVAFP